MRNATSRAHGFTLIELLVVISILSLLAVALLPRVLQASEGAELFADQKNLSWHYTQIFQYNTKKLPYPKEGGHKLVLAPWVKGICEHTEANFDRYWVPGKRDFRRDELKETGLEHIWKRFEDLSTQDTHYAGRASEHYGSMMSGNEAWLADDNEMFKTWQSGSVNVLMGDGTTKELLKVDHLQQYWVPDYDERGFPVGPDSPMPMLQKLKW